MREKTFTNIKLYVLDDYNRVSAFAAKQLISAVRAKKDCVLGLAAGASPMGMYRELVKMNIRGDADFSDVTTFILDEYYPVKNNNTNSFTYIMKENLLNHINIDVRNINVLDGTTTDPASECAEYERKIENAYGIDFLVLGIGLNGHIGFNEPSNSFGGGTRCVALTESTIRANARFFGPQELVPKNALTIGIKTIMMAKKILLIATGAEKARILKDAVTGPITPRVPASVLQLHRDVAIAADTEAARLLL